MKSGIWTSYFMEYSPEEMIRLFASKGLTELELSDEHGAVLLDEGKPEIVGNRLRRYAEGYGVTFPQGHLLLRADIVDTDEDEIVDTLKSWLEMFLALGIKAAVLHPGGYKSRIDGVCQEQIRMKQSSVLRRLTDYLKGTDLTICLENIYRTEPYAENLIEIIEFSGCSNLGICLDTGHLNVVKGDQEEFILKAGKYLKALHIADNEGTHDQHMMPYGRGNIDWDKVLRGLRKIGYNGFFNLEIPGERDAPKEIKLAKLEYIKFMLNFMVGMIDGHKDTRIG